MNSGFYTTAGDDHLSGWTKKKLQSTFQSQTCTTKRSWSLFGHPLPVRSTADSETIISEKYTQQINETHWKRQCPKLVLVSRMGPVLLHDSACLYIIQPVLQKWNNSGYKNFASSAIFIWLLTNWLPLLQGTGQLSAGKILPQPAGGRRVSKSSRNAEAQIFFFFATGINKLISHLQKCIDGNGSHSEKEMATHSSVLAWRIPGMGEPGGLPSMGSHRVGHDWSDLAAAAAWWFKIHGPKLQIHLHQTTNYFNVVLTEVGIKIITEFIILKYSQKS